MGSFRKVYVGLAAAAVLCTALLVACSRKTLALPETLPFLAAPASYVTVTMSIQLPGMDDESTKAGFYVGYGSTDAASPGTTKGDTNDGLRKIPAPDFKGSVCLLTPGSPAPTGANCPISASDRDLSPYADAKAILAWSQKLYLDSAYKLPGDQKGQTKTIVVVVPSNAAFLAVSATRCYNSTQSCAMTIPTKFTLCMRQASGCTPTFTDASDVNRLYNWADSVIALWGVSIK